MAAADLVAGDVVKITMGSKVPADIRLLTISSDLRFDRSILTGESNAIAASTEPTDPNCNYPPPFTPSYYLSHPLFCFVLFFSFSFSYSHGV